MRRSEEGIRDSGTYAEACLKFTSFLTVVAAGILGYLGVDMVRNGKGVGLWVFVLFGIVAVLVASAVFGWKAVDGDDRRNNLATTATKGYFVLLTCLFLLVLWVCLFVTFEFQTIKHSVKRHVENHWQSQWDDLTLDAKQRLLDSGCLLQSVEVPTAYDCAKANGTACYVPKDCHVQCLPDECWTGIKDQFFADWSFAAYICVGLLLMLPIQVYFAGARNTWSDSIDALQNCMAFFMLTLGIGLLVYTGYVSTRPCDSECLGEEKLNDASGKAEVNFVIIGFALLGVLLSLLACIELLPQICGCRSLERKVGKILFFFYVVVSGMTACMSIFCMQGGAGFGVDLSKSPSLGPKVEQIGWALVLVLEFMSLHALTSLADWRLSKAFAMDRSAISGAEYGRAGRESRDHP